MSENDRRPSLSPRNQALRLALPYALAAFAMATAVALAALGAVDKDNATRIVCVSLAAAVIHAGRDKSRPPGPDVLGSVVAFASGELGAYLARALPFAALSLVVMLGAGCGSSSPASGTVCRVAQAARDACARIEQAADYVCAPDAGAEGSPP